MEPLETIAAYARNQRASMTDDIVQLFADTNVFIQMHDIQALPWRDLFPKAKRIDILVSRAVTEELDRLKDSRNERQRKRARLAYRMINEALERPDFTLDLPHRTVGLRLIIATGPVPDWSDLPTLNRDKPDDQLVAEAKSFGGNAVILSHDIGPRVSAARIGIQAVAPPDSWLLQDEESDDKKKVRQLERDLARLINTFPSIVAAFGSLDAPKERFEFVVPVLQPLTPEMQGKLAASYLDRHPRKRMEERQSDRDDAFTLHGSRGDSARSYNDKLYEFEKSVATYFSKLHMTMFLARRAVPVEYAIKNDSGVAAQGLRIEVRLNNGAVLFAGEEDAASTLGSAKPPTLPVFEYGQGPFDRIRIANEISLELNRPRDPTGFYWIAKPKGGAAENALQCADYRATRPWESDIWLRPRSKEPVTVTMEISATNLPAPVIRTAFVSLEAKQLDWSDPIVKGILPEAIKPDFDAAL